MIDVPLATSVPALYEFLDAPPELTQEPVLHGEVRVLVAEEWGGREEGARGGGGIGGWWW